MKIRGACHCGNIRYTYHWPGPETEIPVRACSCAFCVKHAGAYSSHPEGRLEAEIGPGAVSHYRFGHQTADFLVCATCGTLPSATSEIDGITHAVVNVNTFQGIDRSILVPSVTDFEGEQQDERLARRRRNWTADVTLKGL